jgi:hypothetical protein
MSYYVYQNWQAGPHKPVIHKATCGFCNSGTGLQGGTHPRHGKWHGPFPNPAAARAHAATLAPGIAISQHC